MVVEGFLGVKREDLAGNGWAFPPELVWGRESTGWVFFLLGWKKVGWI